MKKFVSFLRKCKKGFTLMECVCAIAVVGLLSAVILPLTSAAIKSMRVSDAIRTAAADASAQNVSVETKKSDLVHTETMYVTVNYNDIEGMRAESAFMFTKTNSENADMDVQVTYYDLKYGKEEVDAN